MAKALLRTVRHARDVAEEQAAAITEQYESGELGARCRRICADFEQLRADEQTCARNNEPLDAVIARMRELLGAQHARAVLWKSEKHLAGTVPSYYSVVWRESDTFKDFVRPCRERAKQLRREADFLDGAVNGLDAVRPEPSLKHGMPDSRKLRLTDFPESLRQRAMRSRRFPHAVISWLSAPGLSITVPDKEVLDWLLAHSTDDDPWMPLLRHPGPRQHHAFYSGARPTETIFTDDGTPDEQERLMRLAYGATVVRVLCEARDEKEGGAPKRARKCKFGD